MLKQGTLHRKGCQESTNYDGDLSEILKEVREQTMQISWEKSTQGRRNRKCKALEAEICLVRSKKRDGT